MQRGTFIVIEGGDGAGKDTQIECIKAAFGEDTIRYVKDPGSTEIGQKIREIVLYNTDVTKKTELLLYLAARTQLVDEMIRPALASGIHVVSNRFDLSTLAYQIYGRERRELLAFVRELSTFAREGAEPDLVLYLDVPVRTGIERARKSGDTNKFEDEELAFHERVREGYHAHLSDYRHAVIDASRSIDEVCAEVREHVGACITADVRPPDSP